MSKPFLLQLQREQAILIADKFPAKALVTPNNKEKLDLAAIPVCFARHLVAHPEIFDS
jgi:hypothetical protein